MYTVQVHIYNLQYKTEKQGHAFECVILVLVQV